MALGQTWLAHMKELFTRIPNLVLIQKWGSAPNLLLSRTLQDHRTIGALAKKPTNLCKHGLSMQGHHRTLITVHSYCCIVEGFLRMPQFVMKICYTALKNASEISRNKSSSYTWNVWNEMIIKRRRLGLLFKVSILSQAIVIEQSFLLFPTVYLQKGNLLCRFGPSSSTKVKVILASSSKNSVAKASHHKLSLSSVRCWRRLFISWIR